ncbi:MAG: helix-turn-helix transcriptional regulator, partial [Chloroflexi bacterium]|nr:helix-turn-helix transcriptional regulator [Chloroflexota bacterium]
MVEIGQRTAALRKRVGISQQRLAEMLGVSRTTITQIENGKRKVSADELVRLSEIYNLSVDNLLSSKEEPEVIFTEKQEAKKMESPIRINVPQRNLKKFKEVLLYMLNKVGSKPNIGETVLYKLLYFTDFD